MKDNDFEEFFVPPPIPGNPSDTSTVKKDGEFIPPPLPTKENGMSDSFEKHDIPEYSATSKRGVKKKCAVAVLAIVVLVVVLCATWGRLTSLLGVNGLKSESDYKDAISDHLYDVHGQSIASYESIDVSEGRAEASVVIDAPLEFGGVAHLNVSIEIDANGTVRSCSFCDLHGTQNNDASSENSDEQATQPQNISSAGSGPETTVANAADLAIHLTDFSPVDQQVVFTYSDGGEYLQKFDIAPISDTVYNVKIVSVAFGGNEAFCVERVLSEVGTISYGEAIKAELALGDMDTRGIMYTDDKGKVHAFSINTTGRDGSVCVTPIETIQYSSDMTELMSCLGSSYGEISDAYGSLVQQYYLNGCEYCIFANERAFAFGFEKSQESMLADDAKCTCIRVTAEMLFENLYGVIDLQSLQGLLDIDEIYTDNGQVEGAEGTGRTAEWFLGNSGISVKVEMTEAEKLCPEDVVTIIYN